MGLLYHLRHGEEPFEQEAEQARIRGLENGLRSGQRQIDLFANVSDFSWLNRRMHLLFYRTTPDRLSSLQRGRLLIFGFCF